MRGIAALRGVLPKAVGLRGRVLGWYVLLLAVALGISSLLIFEAATLYQEDTATEKLREEAFDFEAAIGARTPSESVAEAVGAYLSYWPPQDREALVVKLNGRRPRAAGPVGTEPEVVETFTGVSSRRYLSLETNAGDARVLVAPLLVDGRRHGTFAAVHLT